MARIISEEEAFGVPAAQAPSGSFDTKLSPPEEAAFGKWKARYAPKDSGGDYDLRGAFKAGLTPAGAEAGADAGHWPDTFKKPNHPTFSTESIYAKYGNPGTWGGPNRDQYVPGQRKKRIVPEDVATRTDTLGESVKRDMRFGGQALDALSSMGRDLGKGTVAAADMFLGLPGQLFGIGADIGARTNALLSGESRRIQGLAGQSAKALVPEWMTTPLQSLMKAAGGGEPLDQSIVGQGIDQAGSWIEKTSRGLLTKEDVASLLDTGMAAGGVRFSPAIVKYGMDRVQDRMAAPERARLAAEASRKRIALAEAERAGQQIRPTREVVNETTGVLTAEEVAKRTAARAKDVRTAFRDKDTADTLAFTAEERLRNEAAYNETQVRENLGKVAAPFERPVPGETLEGVIPKSKIFDPVIVGETSPILMDAWGKLKEGKGHDLTATEKIYLREHAQKLEKQLGEGVPDKLSRGERGSINQDLLKVLGTAAAVGGGTYLGILGYKLWKDYEQSQGSGNIAPSPEKSEEQLRKEIEDFHRRRGDDLPTGPSPREVPESTTPRPNAEGNYLAEAQDVAKRFGDIAGTGMVGLGALGMVRGAKGLAHLPEHVLIAKARLGEQAAITELYNREAPKLERLIARYTGDAAKAQDIVQETMLSAFNALRKAPDEAGGFRGDAKLGTWLHTAALNRAKNSFAAAERRVQTVSDIPEGGGIIEPSNGIAESPVTPEAQLQNKQLRERIQAGLDKLDPRFREAFEAREFEGKSYEDIAAETNVPIGTVRSRIARAKDALIQHLKDNKLNAAAATSALTAFALEPENADKVALAAGALGVVKGKGGMWHPEAVSRLASPLRDRLSGAEQNYGIGLEYLMTAEEIAKNPAAVWSDKAVRGWLNKHAGTATDPLKDVEVPFKEGTKRWEELTDKSLSAQQYDSPVNAKSLGVRVGEDVWQVTDQLWGQNGGRSEFGALKDYLSHVGDYLLEHVPFDKLQQYDLVRAVKETAAWDKELAKKMNDVQKAEKTVSPVLKEFPDGMYWQQLTKPGQFARESDVMGHSVRGYEPPGLDHWAKQRHLVDPETFPEAKAHPDWILESGDSGHANYGVGGWDAIKSGDAKVYSLRDKEGKSHVTIEVGKDGHQRLHEFIDESTVKPDSILQIKGKQNRAPDAKYLPYVQDFVKGGKWGKVGDSENAGLVLLRDKYLTKEEISAITSKAADSLNKPLFGWSTTRGPHGVPEIEVIKFLKTGELTDTYKHLLSLENALEWAVGKGAVIPEIQRGSADPKLLAGIAAAGGAATLGAYIDSDNPIRGAILGALGVAGFGAFAKGGTKGLDVALGAVSTRLGHVSDSLKLRARDYERTVLNMTDKALDEVSPFLKGIGKLPAAAQEQLKQALLTGDGAAISAALKGKPELVDAYRKVRNLLNDFEKSHVEMGRFKEGLTNYFPRVVTDLKGLLEGVGKTHAEGIEKILVNAEAKMVKEQQRGLTDIEQSVLIDRYLKSKDQSSFQPGYAKQRGIETVDSKLSKFYADPKESLLRYVSAAVQDQQLAKFFGRDLAKKSVGGRAYTDTDASIGNLIQRELKEGNITREQIGEVRQILKSRFEGGEKTPNSFIQEWRNLNNITLLGQLQSAATQMGDSVMTIYHHGLLPTMQALKEKLTGDARVTTKEFGLTNHIMEELGSNRFTGKVLQGLFKTSGFSLVDQFAKGLNLNAGLIKNQKLAKTAAGQANLTDKYGKAFGDEFPQLIKDLQNGTKSERVKSLLFSELSDAQPISKMEMPEAYLNNPNGRILYQMKTYMLKQMDVIRRDAYDEIAKGNYVKGAKNLLAVSAALSLSNVPGDLVKDWISGRPIDLTKIDYVENLMRNFGVSKFSLDKAQKGKPLEAAADILLPPFKHYQEIGELGDKAVKYIPYAGRTIYDRELGGNEKRVLAERKQQRLKDRDAAESQDPGMKARRLERQRQAKEKAMQKARSY